MWHVISDAEQPPTDALPQNDLNKVNLRHERLRYRMKTCDICVLADHQGQRCIKLLIKSTY